MLLHNKIHQFLIKPFSTSTRKTKTKTKTTSINWRSQIKQTQLVNQISSILLQRHNWPSLLQNLNLSSKLTPSLFLQILRKTQHNPQVSLNFFNWITTNLHFKPGLKSQCHIIQLLLRSGQTQSIKPILDSLIQTNTATLLTHSIIQACKGKEMLPKCFLSGNDSVIQKLCDLGKTYAAEMIFKRACDENFGLQDDTYGCMLRALSKEGRAKEAIQIYRVILERGITVKDSSYYAFVHVLCKEDESEEVCGLLRDVVQRGYSPCAMELSKFVASHCGKGRWREVEELLNAVLNQGLLLDSFCCCSLMEHYCSDGQIDKATALHCKMEKLKGSLDVATYDILLDGLFKDGRMEDAVRIFDYMKDLGVVSSSTFVVMISRLCCVKELRKAMKFHDEMLKMGHKPDEGTYKRLISGFN